MEESRLVVNSPRRTLSLLRRSSDRNNPFRSTDNAASRSEFAGPKPSEVYGFVGSITTVISSVIYLVWAYTPEPWLHSLGFTYYPSKYWALAVPSFLIVSVILAMVLYLGLNFLSTPPPTSLNTIYDEYSRDGILSLPDGMGKPIDPISDVGIDHINNLMFG
ncbi:hypothetical protein LUZ60_014331 [Juncus effusus]|nr:hypothetical protein LUZ60_014331 [Juncus effusus]